jgi:hypothetical protein
MKKLLDFWKQNSAHIVAIVLALVAAGLIPGTLGKVLGIVLPLLGGQLVHNTVFAPATVVQKVTDAATQAVATITPDIAGGTTEVTSAGQAVIDQVVKAIAPT